MTLVQIHTQSNVVASYSWIHMLAFQGFTGANGADGKPGNAGQPVSSFST